MVALWKIGCEHLQEKKFNCEQFLISSLVFLFAWVIFYLDNRHDTEYKLILKKWVIIQFFLSRVVWFTEFAVPVRLAMAAHFIVFFLNGFSAGFSFKNLVCPEWLLFTGLIRLVG